MSALSGRKIKHLLGWTGEGSKIHMTANKTLTVDNSLELAGTDSTVMTFPNASDTVVTLTASQTLTNKTLTSPTISGSINTNTVRCSAPVTKNASTAYANVTGLTYTVVPGTYKFTLMLPSTVANGTGGIKYAFNYTTTVLSSLEATSQGYTASAVAVQHTTSTTTQADLFTQAAVVIFTQIEGTFVVTTGGTIDVQMAQNTSDGSNTIALLGGSATFTRLS